MRLGQVVRVVVAGVEPVEGELLQDEVDDAERGEDDVSVGGGDRPAADLEYGLDQRPELRLVEEGEAALEGLSQDLPRPLEGEHQAGRPQLPHAQDAAERDEDGAEEGGGGGGAEAGRADHEVAGGEEVGVAGAVVVQQLQDGVVDPGLALREVLLRRAGWNRKDG